jgi:hypothetical protein
MHKSAWVNTLSRPKNIQWKMDFANSLTCSIKRKWTYLKILNQFPILSFTSVTASMKKIDLAFLELRHQKFLAVTPCLMKSKFTSWNSIGQSTTNKSRDHVVILHVDYICLHLLPAIHRVKKYRIEWSSRMSFNWEYFCIGVKIFHQPINREIAILW